MKRKILFSAAALMLMICVGATAGDGTASGGESPTAGGFALLGSNTDVEAKQSVQLDNMVGSARVNVNPKIDASNRVENNPDQKTNAAALSVGSNVVNFGGAEAPEYNQNVPGIPGLYLPYSVPFSQLPEGGYFVRDPLSGVHQGCCTMADVPVFLKYARNVFGYWVWENKPFTIDSNGQVSLAVKMKGRVPVSLSNTIGFRRAGHFKYAINVKSAYLSRPTSEKPRVWIEAALDKGVVFDLPTLMEKYYYVGQVVVVGDIGILSSQVIEFAEGLALVGHVDVGLLTNSVLLKNSTMAVQPGMSVAQATPDIGLGGLLAAIIGEAKMKGNQWAALWLFTEIPDGVEIEQVPAGVKAAYKLNGNGNGNGKPVQQEGPPPEILTQRR
ncbi:MAG: hypothetical protein V1889_03280 [archaeon]